MINFSILIICYIVIEIVACKYVSIIFWIIIFIWNFANILFNLIFLSLIILLLYYNLNHVIYNIYQLYNNLASC